ncbi:MAG: TPM domain-containing protein [Dokdonella sp.]
MNRLQRILANLFRAWWLADEQFPDSVFDTIGARIGELEAQHHGDVVFAVEARLALKVVAQGLTAQQRAEEVFAGLEVWNTADNAGVLIYVLLAERAIEIVADRGIARQVPQSRWDDICADSAAAFSRGEFESGAFAAIEAASMLLREFMPILSGQARSNELVDRPVLL